MIGIRFEIPNKEGNYLYPILKTVEKDNYVWKIMNDDVHKNNDFFFDKEVYRNDELLSKVKNNEYYLVFLQLFGFEKDEDIRDIENYVSYKSSDCRFAIDLLDSSYVEIYSKEQKTLEALCLTAQKNNFKNIEYINNDDDSIWKANSEISTTSEVI